MRGGRSHLCFIGQLLVIGLLGLLAACSQISNDSPKDVVIKFFGAMERNDTGRIAHLLDLPALMNIRDQDYALQTDSPRVFRNPDDILGDLTDGGLTKTRWFAMQRVIGNTEANGDTAFVEVSFIDKNTNTQYYNKFGLHKPDGRWKIFSFKTISAAQ